MSVDARYTRIAIMLHWLIAVLMLINIALGLSAESLPDSWVRTVIDTHKSIGISVLGLALLRLLWRAVHRPPPLPGSYAAWERRLSHAAHWALYAMMLALPLSGWLHDSAWKDAAAHPMQLFGVLPWPRIAWITQLPPGLKESLHGLFGEWHEWLGYGFYGLVALHIGAALKHQFIDRHPELQRMSL